MMVIYGRITVMSNKRPR